MARTKLARTTDQPGVRTYAVAKVTPSDTRTGLEPPSLTQKKKFTRILSSSYVSPG